MNKQGLVTILFVVLGLQSYAQDRFMVFFTDKENSEYSIDNPEEFLSTRSIERKERFGIEITTEDLPVVQSYVQGLMDTGADVYFTSRWFNSALVQMDQNRVSAIESLAFVDRVEYIARGVKLTRSDSRIDVSDFQEVTYDLASSQKQNAMMNVDDMHIQGFRGKDIIIAVFDGGFLGVNQYQPFENIFNENRFIAGKDFVYNTDNPFQYHDHGTKVLSCIGAEYGDYTGTAPKASFVLAVTEDVRSEYRIEEYNWLLAAEFADSIGADIIHSSVGYSVFSDAEMNYSYDDLDGSTAVITRAANEVVERGMVVVTSAGNEGQSSWQYITAPADARNILAVGSIREDYTLSGFSSKGPTADGRLKPEVVAQGSKTAIINSQGMIVDGNGTSYAAPLVAGLVAGVWQTNPDWTNIEVVNAIKLTASRATSPDTLFGYGVPDYIEAAVGRVLSISDIINDQIKVYPNPFRDNRIWIDLSQPQDIYPLNIQVFDVRGSVILEDQVQNYREKIELNIPSSDPGTYFLRLEGKSFSKSVKLIKY